MERKGEDVSTVTVTNGGYSVRCTEEVLVPFFIDDSLQAVMEKQHTVTTPSVPNPLPELRLVLLGRKGAGKSSAGNTLLGGVGEFESGKPTEECVKRREDVGGRRVTVVDTPGWEWYYPLNSTPDWVRRETSRSVLLCPPGPHAVLLVVRSCAAVTEAYVSQIEEHVEPLGNGIWDYTMVLFTRGDELGLLTVEQRILTSGPGLQKLLRKCGNRYHVLDNRSKGDGTQVKELTRKIEEMVEGKKEGARHFGVGSIVLLGLEADGKRRARERRKKQRHMEMEMQRGTIKAALMGDGPQALELDTRHSFSKGPRRLPELRLVLLGERETGKSSTGNTLLGYPGLFQMGTVTEECVRQQAEVSMRLVTVVDTPGWEGGISGPTPERVKREIVGSVAFCLPGPHALLLTLRVDTLVRVGHVREHLELLGEGVWRHTILLFTHGDQLREGVGIEQHIQSGGRDLQWMLERCCGRYHVISNVDGGAHSSIPVTELLEKVEKMATGNRCEAFLGLINEVSNLSQQKNERFNQRLKEVTDKLLRQESELKKMREREVRSIRWFFDRKKKAKSPGKIGAEKEEEEEDEERRSWGRKNEMRELEERMQWLTEDKEREIQDLSTEHDRILAALHRSRQEKVDADLRLELKESEIEEMKERIDEQQLKLLDLERIALGNDRERTQREAETEEQRQEWVRERGRLVGAIERQDKENAELMAKVEALRAETRDSTKRFEDSLSQYEREGERRKEEHRREMAEMERQLKAEMESKLRGMEKEAEEIRLEMKSKMREKVEELTARLQREMEGKLGEKQREVEDIKWQHNEEMARKASQVEKLMEELRVQHQEDTNEKLKEKEIILERVKQMHQTEIRDRQQEKDREIRQLEQQFAKQIQRNSEENEKGREGLEQEHAIRMAEKRREHEKEKEGVRLNHEREMARKLLEKDREMEEVKRRQVREMEDTRRRGENEKERLVLNHEKEMERKLKEREREIEEMRRHIRETAGTLERQDEEKRELILSHKKEEDERREEGEREKGEMKRRITEMEGILQGKEEEKREVILNHAKEAAQRQKENEREIEEIKLHLQNAVNEKLREREIEMEALKQETEIRETKVRDEQKRKEEAGEKEINRLIEIVRRKTDEITEMQQLAALKDEEIEAARERCAGHSEEIKGLKENNAKQMEIQQRLAEQERKRDTEMMEGLRGKEEELENLRRKDGENERELSKLRLTIELTKSELKGLTSKMDTEMNNLIKGYEKEIAERKGEIESVLEEKENTVSQLRWTEEEGRQRASDLAKKYMESQQALEGLQGGNEKLRNELGGLSAKCEKLENECVEHERERERREEEMKDLLSRYEEKTRSKDKELQNILYQRDVEVAALQQRSEALKREMEGLKERESGSEMELKKMTELYQRQLAEKQSELETKDEGFRVEILKRGRELEAKKQALAIHEGELSEKVKTLEMKEADIAEREGKLENRERELTQREAGLQTKQRDHEEKQKAMEKQVEELLKQERTLNAKMQNAKGKERELEYLLETLENKQEEQKCHGRDLQEKVRELKEWGKALEEKEQQLKSEEQELIRWRAEAERMDAMASNLAKRREEIDSRERDLRDAVEKLRKQELGLEIWEAEIHQMENSHGRTNMETESRNSPGFLLNGLHSEFDGQQPSVVCGMVSRGLVEAFDSPVEEENIHVIYQQVSVADEQERREVERGKGSDQGQGQRSKDREDSRVETATSAIVNYNCCLETPDEVERAEKEERETDRAELEWMEVEELKGGEESVESKVKRNFRVFSSQREHRDTNDKYLSFESELRVVILAEMWSTLGLEEVTILDDIDLSPAPSPNRSTPKPWRGRIAGRHVSIVEPPGLRWRNGPEPNGTAQTKKILESVCLHHPRPDVLLLVIPAYLTCTQKYRTAVEDHVSVLGEEIWKRSLVVFTWGETLGESAEQHILRNSDLMVLVEKCGGKYHVMDEKKKTLTEGLFQKIDEIVALNNRAVFCRELNDGDGEMRRNC
ncbi:trichohyalin [Lampris incognitus]|uniref:trichohyalin n=1 Tax=Lampris incognitus TaxID=2546036 RepID=UPI0024B50DB7|nr:trichohyalin [Lampris incognitus]